MTDNLRAVGRLLAYVTDEDDGFILEVERGTRIDEEVRMAGAYLCDHDITVAEQRGLLLWEGRVEVGAGPDPDVMLVGAWRRLTLTEMCLVRNGRSPWENEQDASS